MTGATEPAPVLSERFEFDCFVKMLHSEYDKRDPEKGNYLWLWAVSLIHLSEPNKLPTATHITVFFKFKANTGSLTLNDETHSLKSA